MSLSCRVSNIQQQLAQLESESWPGLAEADRDRLQLVKEKIKAIDAENKAQEN